MALVFPRRTESMCLNGWQRIGIAASVVWAIGAPIFQSISCGRNVAFDNLCVIENELQAAMTNPLLRGPVDLLRPSVHGLASSLRLVAPRSCQRISRPCNDLQCRDSGLVQRALRNVGHPILESLGLDARELHHPTHFSVSSAISLPNSAGEPGSTVAPKSAKRAFDHGVGEARVRFTVEHIDDRSGRIL